MPEINMVKAKKIIIKHYFEEELKHFLEVKCMEGDNNKKGLVFISGPKKLLDFLCFYCEQGYQYTWSLVCDMALNMDSDTMNACRRSGIFEQIYSMEHDYGKIGLKAQGLLFLKMFFWAIIGKQKNLCKKLVAQDSPISIDEYDIVVIPGDYIIPWGSFLQLTDELNVVILEDGRGDYIERKWSNLWKSKFSFFEIQGFLLALLGYSNITGHYPLRSTKNADKYAKYPEKLIYRKYKSIHKLDFKNEAYKDKLNELICKTFSVPADESLFTGDVLLFTAYFVIFTNDETEVLDKTIAYINQNCQGKKIILKKHPADKKNYSFDPSIEVVEIDKHVPGELLAAKIDVKECIYMFPSTLLDEYMNIIEDYKILYYDCLNKSKNAERAYDQVFQSVLVNMPVDKGKIIYL